MHDHTNTHLISPPRSWAEISLDNLEINYAFARRKGDTMAVLKAGAYGHGIIPVAKKLESLPEKERPCFIGVASVIEARKLTKAKLQTRIYLLGASCSFEREEIVMQRWTPCISSIAEAQDFDRLVAAARGAPLPVHLAVDTGMGRGGFLPDDILACIDSLCSLTNLIIEGIGSHLPSADEDEKFTLDQFELFHSVINKLGSDRFRYKHLANSAGILAYKSLYTNLHRPGLMLYGISPIPEYQRHLSPIMTLKSRVSLLRKLPKGHGISYGRETILEKETKVATVGIGYGDGYPRALSLKGADVFISGQRCPLLGRVTMDQIMVDVSELNHCEEGDEVELFGENILVSEIARLAGSIPWSILTGITPRVTRFYK